MKILVVEDDTVILKIVEHTLTRAGFWVSPHTDFKSALESLENFKPDLIITDIILPSASGFEIISLIKSNEKQIPVLVISSIDEEATVHETLSLGANDFIVKPFTSAELLERVKNLLPKQGNEKKQQSRSY